MGIARSEVISVFAPNSWKLWGLCPNTHLQPEESATFSEKGSQFSQATPKKEADSFSSNGNPPASENILWGGSERNQVRVPEEPAGLILRLVSLPKRWVSLLLCLEHYREKRAHPFLFLSWLAFPSLQSWERVRFLYFGGDA